MYINVQMCTMGFWKDFFQAIRDYFETRRKSRIQRKRFSAVLGDSKAEAIMLEVLHLRKDINHHLKSRHDAVIDGKSRLGKQEAEVLDLSYAELEKRIGGV